MHVLRQPPTLPELAAAALALRKAQPMLPLLVAAPEKLLRQLKRDYPPLVDVPLTASNPSAVLQGLQSL